MATREERQKLPKLTKENCQELVDKMTIDGLVCILLRDYGVNDSVLFALQNPTEPVCKWDDHEVSRWSFRGRWLTKGPTDMFTLSIHEPWDETGSLSKRRCGVGLSMAGHKNQTLSAFVMAVSIAQADGFDVSLKQVGGVSHYPVEYGDKGATYFCGGSMEQMWTHFNTTVDKYENKQQEQDDRINKFLQKFRLETEKDDKTGRRPVNGEDNVDRANVTKGSTGRFEFLSCCREAGGDYWCDSFCEICDAKQLSSNFEIVFEIQSEGEKRLFGHVVDMCTSCVELMLKESRMFSNGQEAWQKICDRW